MTDRFEGKVAAVTGAAGGIGRAAAQRFAEDGANVVLIDLPGAPIEETVAAVQNAGREALVVEADVTNPSDVKRYVERTREHFGRLDAFFNNAGILGPVSSLFDYPDDAFDKVLQVNVKGVWYGMRETAPLLAENGGGAIVNTASIAGLQGTPTLFAYGASKHAVIGMTKSAAMTLVGQGIRVNAVCPAVIDTPMGAELERGSSPDAPELARQAMQASNLMGRYGTPEEIAALVSFLCSDEASFINGAAYPIDGGGTATRRA
ncbi:MAG: glucose 1-dehydrogenase [Chloroflexi bacterium]|nr:glucose 1-dehydrogenase [Chloroflexota bacterium]MDA1145568.1 glucose 1-dehydrogenase [Chloroflexota bacterium]